MPAIDRLAETRGMKAAFHPEMQKEFGKGRFAEYIESLMGDYLRQFDVEWIFGTREQEKRFKKILSRARPVAKRLADAINSALKEYFDGKPAAAYHALARTLNDKKIRDLLIRRSAFISSRIMRDIPSAKNFYYRQCREAIPEEMKARFGNLQLYRFRKKDSDQNELNREEIFHLPSHERHLVGTNRYSIPGHPCLYLGLSLKVCWEEFGRPSSFFYSQFDLRKKIAVPGESELLGDMSAVRNSYIFILYASDFSPQSVMNELPRQLQEDIEQGCRSQETLHYFIPFFALWPLSLACSIPKLHREAKFHPEYIIPQLLMQWTLDKDYFDTVCYRSTRRDGENGQDTYWNLAFPARDIGEDGYCNRLVKYFHLTKPKQPCSECLDEEQLQEMEDGLWNSEFRPLRSEAD